MEEREVPDRAEDRALVEELLDAVKDRLAPRPVRLRRLLAEQPVDVRRAAVYVGATGDRIGLEPRRGVAEDAREHVDHVPVLLLGDALEQGRPLERPELESDADRLEVREHGLAPRA